ncbi:pilus assembly protein TadE [Novosphingobium barchaimii LL02]|uniref:Pilus assembly protein TadE n=1 Tax=Novosphingobium barchaimii LL02 TaxID=1114963 RepID=A0A0J8A6V6_9SPHN|nr:TadE/TadG family type IV pilus assembly protein [Novosphingobium barchaimii]KMS51125.1 pilus assembly protein TadE [Novosphingobium barchaimii LL02]
MRKSARNLFQLLKCEQGIAALEFVFLAPALLALVFSIIVYSIYFTAVIGVRQAAAEGARAAVAGLSSTERVSLAQARAMEVITNYGAMLGGGHQPVITAGAGTTTGTFQVQVSYDMSGSPIMRYGNFIPLPSSNVQASVVVTNGGY